MAEQISHNVVNEPQSSSAPLVDAASSQTAADSATDGAQQTQSSTSPHTDSVIDVSKSTNELATSSNSSAIPAGPDVVKGAAKPSAGEAAHQSASNSADAPTDVEQKAVEDGSQGDDRSTADIASDTEKKGDVHHGRSDSVKKPTTFSKVSITKNFLNKATPTTAATPSKIGEKASPASAATLTAKIGPRLVAKAGPSLGNLQKARPGPQNVGGPDASKVWNKNRPVPPAPPKQFTDEELKQQYGIHLATRLQADEGGNDSKWADIDDEDDWAPEAVEWMDGTKSTVAPQEVAPSEPQILQRPAQPQAPAQRTVLHLAPRTQPPVQEPAPAAPAVKTPATQPEAPKLAPADTVKPNLAPKRSDSQSMKILKPGAAAIQAKLNGPSASGTDKPSLKAKNPAPPQTSPWKPVPKPDSISAINPPTQMPQAPTQFAPLASQDARSYEQPQQQIPARQIAADTFDRSWKEGEGGARELFNSANGRYEPAPEGRRSSVKHDTHRKPAVLQRQLHGGPSPAEPSAAFQSRTSAPTDGIWGNRRRGSSVSQRSNSAARRMSLQRGHELPAAVFEGAPPTGSRNEPAKPKFSQQSAWDQQMPTRPAADGQPSPSLAAEAVPTAEPAPSAEEAAKMQARVMKEKRELAQKRRKEEEERDEAAKAERLAAKLAALGGVGKSKKERDAEAAAAAAAAMKNASKAPAGEPAPVVQPNPAKPAETSIVESLEAKTQSPPPPPAQQQLAPQGPQPPLAKQQTAGIPDRSDIDQTQKQVSRGGSFQQTNSAGYKQSPSSYSSPGDRPLQPFVRSPNNLNGGDSFTPWPTTAPNSNVWGTSGIGNGTFQNSGAFAPLPMVQQGSSLPLPPGMNRTPNSARISPQSFDAEPRSPHMHQQQMGEQQRAYPPPGIDARPDAFGQARRNGAPTHGLGNRQVHPPGPIGPPSRAQNQQQQSATRPPPSAGGAWDMVSHQLTNEFAADGAAAAAAAAKRQEMVNAPSRTADTRFTETFKKTAPNQGPLGGPRRYEKAEHFLHESNGSRSQPTVPTEPMTAPAAPPSAQTQPPAAFSGASVSQDIRNHHTIESTVRIPQFPQNPEHGGQQPPIGRPNGQHMSAAAIHGNANFPMAPLAPSIASKEQSPPPPEADGHPVNLGADSVHPHVKLPRPLAKVRLPPASPPSHQQLPTHNGSVLMPQRPNSSYRQTPPGAARPIVQDGAWQARFSSLFGRVNVQTETPPSPPKTPPKMSLAVASATRAPLDNHTASATVSLPQAHRTSAIPSLGQCAVLSKPAIDEMFKDELSFGSMPKVSIPRHTSYDNSPPPRSMKNMLKMGSNSKAQKQVDSQSIHWSDHFLFPKNPSGYFANVPHTPLNKMCHYIGGERHMSGKKSHVLLNNQERRPSGRQNKSTRGRRDSGEPGFQVAPVNLGTSSRKLTGPRRHQPTADSATDGGGRGGGHNKAVRGRRTHGPATSAAAPVATPAPAS